MEMGEYTSSNLFLISGQLLAPLILFSILYGVIVDLAVASSYCLLLVSNLTFSIYNDQSAKSMFLSWYMNIWYMIYYHFHAYGSCPASYLVIVFVTH